jgi:hypothetical protein
MLGHGGVGQDYSDYSAHTRGRLAHFVLHIPKFISNRAFLSDATLVHPHIVVKVFRGFPALRPVRLSMQIRDWLMFVICLRTLEPPRTAVFSIVSKQLRSALLSLTLTTPVSTARTICSSDFSEAPDVVC